MLNSLPGLAVAAIKHLLRRLDTSFGPLRLVARDGHEDVERFVAVSLSLGLHLAGGEVHRALGAPYRLACFRRRHPDNPYFLFGRITGMQKPPRARAAASYLKVRESAGANAAVRGR
jgi:hypothetical protein